MNILKFKKIILAVLFIQLWGTRAIKTAPINAPVETYFLPEDVKEFNNQLANLLDSAKEQVLVAMYWLTDKDIIQKFISLKQKGIDVQIIFDESGANAVDLVEELMANDIIPYVLPKTNGIMHNKFLVIDGRAVLTGSANFTKTVLGESLRYFNNENVLIIDSKQIAEKYRDDFFGIEDVIARVYIDLVANQWPNQLPAWMRYVSLILHKNDPNFVNLLTELYPTFNPAQQDRLMKFFPNIPLTAVQKQEEPATPNQRAFLEARGVFEEGMSKQEASDLIDQLKLISQPPVQQQPWSPASEYQRNKLLEAGLGDDDIDRFSYDEAYEAIGRMRQGEQLVSHHVERELPTQKQINLLLSKGFKEYQIDKMTKQSATAAISKLLKGRRPY